MTRKLVVAMVFALIAVSCGDGGIDSDSAAVDENASTGAAAQASDLGRTCNHMSNRIQPSGVIGLLVEYEVDPDVIRKAADAAKASLRETAALAPDEVRSAIEDITDYEAAGIDMYEEAGFRLASLDDDVIQNLANDHPYNAYDSVASWYEATCWISTGDGDADRRWLGQPAQTAQNSTGVDRRRPTCCSPTYGNSRFASRSIPWNVNPASSCINENRSVTGARG